MSTTTVPPLAGMSGRRALATAGSAYVAAWLVGLATAPSAPSPDAADATIQRFYADDGAATLFHAVNVADTVKLVLLAVAIAAATRLAARAHALPRWVRALGRVLSPVLVIGGAAFVFDSDGLSAVLAVSLVLLLLWVGAVTYAVTRGGRLRPPRGVAA